MKTATIYRTENNEWNLSLRDSGIRTNAHLFIPCGSFDQVSSLIDKYLFGGYSILRIRTITSKPPYCNTGVSENHNLTFAGARAE